MNWRSEWEAISARIEGLLSAATFFVTAQAVNSGDSYNVSDKHIGKEAREIVVNLRAFLAAHGRDIRPEAAKVLDRFLSEHGTSIDSDSVKGIEAVSPV